MLYRTKNVAIIGFASQVSVTPSDATVTAYDAIYIGSGGNVAIMIGEDTAAVTWPNVTAGTLIYCNQITRVMATNTTATNIVGLNYLTE